MRAVMILMVTILCVSLSIGTTRSSWAADEYAGIEGRAVDADGTPISGVTVTAKQVVPLKGYDRTETATNANGLFTLEKLYPNAEYELFFWKQEWSDVPVINVFYEAKNLIAPMVRSDSGAKLRFKTKLVFRSGPANQTALLSSPVVMKPAKSGVQVKVLDGRGKPMPNVRVIAEMKTPIGISFYDHAEATTDQQGVVRFENLYPRANYELTIEGDGWKTGKRIAVQAPRELEINSMPEATTIRFVVKNSGEIRDSGTGLVWAPSPGKDVTFSRAIAYVRSLDLGGHSDWRIPSKSELATLCIPNLDPAFKGGGPSCFWTPHPDSPGAGAAWRLSPRGLSYWAVSTATMTSGVLAVRLTRSP